ncbi:MAG: UDP-N-acetylmuramoyl-L-alanine--D-glutamate ligase [Erysipelotrichaceae bacterium]|nr:UDP-N-acetylmuramoyl-L-alanine--D-glutamate ligase [Erysipelotrichaceae bacterium]
MNSTVLVIGAGISGLGISKFLCKRGKHVVLTDGKKVAQKEELQAMGIEVYDEGHPDHLRHTNYEYVVKNPGIPYYVDFVNYFVQQGMPIYNEIEVALWYAPNFNVGAITGTNGKTTTTTLLAELLKRKNPLSVAAGNIGKAMSDIVEEHMLDALDVSLEIAAFQLLGTKKFSPSVSVIMNLTPDHVDYFGDVDKYYEAKTIVYRNQSENGYFLRNVDDALVMEYCKDIPCHVLDFSLVRTDVDICVKDGYVYLKDVALFEVSKLHLVGKHNLQNAMVAASMAYLMGVSQQDIEDGIDAFKGVEHRIEYVDEIAGVRYYNDSKGTNVDATIVALKAFEQPVHLLAGGYDKKTGFDDLKPYLTKVKQMYVFGEVKEQLVALCPTAIVVNTMEEAIVLAHQNAKEGEVVLLSPACASWDQFPNFEVRGNLFKERVKQLKG